MSTIRPNGLPWEDETYNDVLDRRIELAIGVNLIAAGNDSVRRPFFPQVDRAQVFTLQDYLRQVGIASGGSWQDGAKHG